MTRYLDHTARLWSTADRRSEGQVWASDIVAMAVTVSVSVVTNVRVNTGEHNSVDLQVSLQT